MNQSQIEIFNAVAEGRTLQAAAEELGITQSAATKRLQSLEQDLDVRLFRKIGRQLQLTEDGERVLQSTSALMSEWNAMKKDLWQRHQGQSGGLKLAASHYVGTYWLAPLIAKLFSKTSQNRLQLNLMPSEAAIAALQRHEVDLAICTEPATLPPNLSRTELFEEEMHLVAQPGFFSQPPSHQDLIDAPCVFAPPSSATSSQLAQLFGDPAVTLNIVVSSNQISSLAAMVNHGVGWSLLPKSAIRPQMQIYPQNTPITRKISAFESDSQRPVRVAKRLKDLIRNVAGATL